MLFTVQDVLQSVGATIDQDTTLPEGTELLTRVQFCQRAQLDWFEFYNWQELRRPFAPTVLASMTSIGLPQNFVRLASPVYDYSGGIDSPFEYQELNSPSDRFRKLSTDKFVYVAGDDSSGRSLQIRPALASGVSLNFEYQCMPSSLASINNTITCPSLQFMAKRVSYYILQARSDSRFQIVQAESDTLLGQLLERQDTPTGGQNNRVPNWMSRQSFRPGRD